MSRGKAFTAQRWEFAVDGHKFILVKGDSRFSKFYVLDEAGNYLTSKGHATLLGAQIEATTIARTAAPA